MAKDIKVTENKPSDAIVSAMFDATLDKDRPPKVSDTGNPTLDACLNDPATRKQIGETVASGVLLGGSGGFATGAAIGAGLMGLAWALWPKGKK